MGRCPRNSCKNNKIARPPITSTCRVSSHGSTAFNMGGILRRYQPDRLGSLYPACNTHYSERAIADSWDTVRMVLAQEIGSNNGMVGIPVTPWSSPPYYPV